MRSHLPTRRRCNRSGFRLCRSRKFLRLAVEPLEDRTMLDTGVGESNPLPPAIVVGRTLSAYFTGDVKNNQETITYTVYNEQADPETGVLLTDTLSPGETIASDLAPQPDQSGQNLAWSLGTIQGYDRASVTLTLNLPSPTPLQLDIGAQAFATLDAGAVSNATPAATLRRALSIPTCSPPRPTPTPLTRSSRKRPPSLATTRPRSSTSCTPTSATSRTSAPCAARGARSGRARATRSTTPAWAWPCCAPRASRPGTLQGTLSDELSQQLILSMFPDWYRRRDIPAGTEVADPAHDPKLLAETRDHYWIEFDAGQGFQDADPELPGASRPEFTTATAPSPRCRMRCGKRRPYGSERRSPAPSAARQATTVLNQTFNEVELVGKFLSIGHFVNSFTPPSLFISVTTNTYSPYIDVGDVAFRFEP